MNKIRASIAALLTGLCLSSVSATANTFGTDMTDLWWNPSESGWGVTATHQGEIVFLTFFVFGADNTAHWYAGQASYTGTNGQGAAIFSGPMYQMTGPWFGTFFNPNGTSVRQVGNVTMTAFVDTATLSYSIDGVSVFKNITRQTFRLNSLTAQYAGAMQTTASGCASAANNGALERTMAINVANSNTTVSNSSFSMATNDGATICSYTGDYVQSGRMGASRGTYVCPGISGTYNLFEIEANPSGLTARYSASDNLCSQYSGRFGGVKR